ncbi:hypothetical protein [Microbacterium oleivorans]|uniref:Uncharacterized protein n=1 Tax=Microbacterium oleivorans TaxID=273677 RepID=A0A4R5YF60_9MICO|nr:hypothetical protein [Microbacterium oleivorans]TDL43593.1 hypothetical protein E2R54_10290 [Microbacterium oleivorans]
MKFTTPLNQWVEWDDGYHFFRIVTEDDASKYRVAGELEHFSVDKDRGAYLDANGDLIIPAEVFQLADHD